MPPLSPSNPIDNIFFFFAFFKTSIIFFDFPDVDITIKISFFFAKASKGLEKISLKL